MSVLTWSCSDSFVVGWKDFNMKAFHMDTLGMACKPEHLSLAVEPQSTGSDIDFVFVSGSLWGIPLPKSGPGL